MHVTQFTTFAELAPLAADWDRLAQGGPFRSWLWQSAWWRHYGSVPSEQRQKRRLYVLVVFGTDGVPVGIAPWYCDSTLAKGRILRFLGLGEIASDHLTVLCQPDMAKTVTDALANWLTEANKHPTQSFLTDNSSTWDLLELTGVDAQDAIVTRLAEAMETHGHTVYRRPGPNCWSIELPDRWQDFLAACSKNRRKHLSDMSRKWLDTGRATVHWVEHPADLAVGQQNLIDLHQRRWQSRGEPGCFASPQFTAFHREVMPELLHRGRLCLAWLEVDGRPIAADYALSDERVIYGYLSGLEPIETSCSPGHLLNMLIIRHAIEKGYREYDFLRGDESYKAQWHAQPRPTIEIRVVAPRASAWLRHTLWRTGSRVKRSLKKGLLGCYGPTRE